MIDYFKGDLFSSDADVLCHGCNTQGKMGAGIALDFRRLFPEMYKDYRQRCRDGLFLPGDGYMFRNADVPHVINLATQADSSAKIEYVDSSFRWLAENYGQLEIASVAMPRIGAGLGGLDWRVVKELLNKNLGSSDLAVEVWSF